MVDVLLVFLAEVTVLLEGLLVSILILRHLRFVVVRQSFGLKLPNKIIQLINRKKMINPSF